ncbi:response regulator [Desulfurispirillum indicum]|uniref:Response regulatory domain-containing protein n=1 Tax=Desulfurispirillum indicum (strain ATCC BAA-1389 / DSM 22839 / S5) TaxID=653733 RepID=E6W5Y9_DESIS|nr:response regulator [Desulfurispirillum indicum]ADU64928.1 hypothetical protein Selin_0171 [Desulfurispirillum indicum S5]UCZ56865.1 response regulator [Desulfurispirillum indicum]
MTISEQNPLDGQSILYVDADETTRTLISRMLSKRGARVAAVASAGVALKAFHVQPPSTVIAGQDVGEPALPEFIRALQGENSPATPVILYTESSLQDAAEIPHLFHVPRNAGFGVLVKVLQRIS